MHGSGVFLNLVNADRALRRSLGDVPQVRGDALTCRVDCILPGALDEVKADL